MIRPQPTSIFPSPYPTDDPLLRLIGNTPVVAYPGIADERVQCKMESANPTGSMKDRVALGILLEAVAADEDLDTVVEASSGNTAGAVALVANRLGLRCHLTCPETTSPHKLGYMRAFGATVHLCPAVDSSHPDHYRATAGRLADELDAFLINQYENQGNPTVHARWTGPELWAQLDGQMTHLVCAMGTGGLMSGTARYVKQAAAEAGRSVRTVGVDAVASNIANSFYGEPLVPYETIVEGLGKNQKLSTMWFDAIDEIRRVADDTAFAQARTAARDHGLLIGPSAGAALHVALQVHQEDPSALIGVVICDGGDQYFDTLFADPSVG